MQLNCYVRALIMVISPKNSTGKIDAEDFLPQPVSNISNLDPNKRQSHSRLEQAGMPKGGLPVSHINPQKKNTNTDPVDAVIDTVGNAAGKTLDIAEGVTGAVMHPVVMLGAPAAVGVIKKTGEGLEKLGNKIKSDTTGTIGKKFQGAAGYVENTTLRDAVGDNRFSRAIAKPANWLAGVGGKIAAWVSGIVPVDKWSGNAAEKSFAKLENSLKDYTAKHQGNLPSQMQGTVQNALDELVALKGKLASAANHAEITTKLNGLREGVHNAALNIEFAPENKKAGKAAIKAFNGLMKTADKSVVHHARINGWKNMGTSVKELPKTIAGTKLVPAVMNTAFIASSGLGMLSAVRGFSANLASLKEVYSDITGKKASTFQVLFSDAPEPVRQARSHLLKQLAFSETMGGAGLAIAAKMAMNSRISPLAIGAQVALGMGGSMAIGESYLPYYTSFKQAHAAGQEVPVEAYAGFLGTASSALKARGGEESIFTRKLAEQYAANKTSPEQMMREISNGTLEKRVHSMIAENEAAKKVAIASSEAAKKNSSAAGAAVGVSHVAALQGNKALEQKQVVGKHTAAEIASRSSRAHDALAHPTFGGA